MGIRIDRVLDTPPSVEISVDGRPVSAFAGETLATALHANGIRRFRSHPGSAAPRGMFCLMGVCQECLVEADGRPVTACLEPVREGMTVTLGPVP
jgi:NADH dehydrogenase/NADH:ubiquinone oxidoreductase subunit G